MTYSVKEMFKTLQGEGAHAGRPAVFCRFTGCNLWSGLERDRATAQCTFCDTDFVGTNGVGGGKFATAEALADALIDTWGPDPDADADRHASDRHRYVVFTGGEPLLQLDAHLIRATHRAGFTIAVETNGTIAAPPGIDWICVSPKAGTELVQREGNELKLVYPQPEATPEQFTTLAFDRFYLQPMDGPDQADNIQASIAYCLAHPRWRLSLQTHKLIGIP
ncbi:MAG: 7-carboxy-7-deazaguanine synthase [Pseudomonadota bacterium]